MQGIPLRLITPQMHPISKASASFFVQTLEAVSIASQFITKRALDSMAICNTRDIAKRTSDNFLFVYKVEFL